MSATTIKDIESLIEDLNNSHMNTRKEARESLAEMGELAVDRLITALSEPRDQVRWQAAWVLGDIGNPRAAPALIEALEDPAVEVRWRAAESLAALKQNGLTPLLETLIRKSNSVWLREGARHVLRERAVTDHRLKNILTPVLTALKGRAPVTATPVAASNALKMLKAANFA